MERASGGANNKRTTKLRGAQTKKIHKFLNKHKQYEKKVKDKNSNLRLMG